MTARKQSLWWSIPRERHERTIDETRSFLFSVWSPTAGSTYMRHSRWRPKTDGWSAPNSTCVLWSQRPSRTHASLKTITTRLLLLLLLLLLEAALFWDFLIRIRRIRLSVIAIIISYSPISSCSPPPLPRGLFYSLSLLPPSLSLSLSLLPVCLSVCREHEPRCC